MVFLGHSAILPVTRLFGLALDQQVHEIRHVERARHDASFHRGRDMQGCGLASYALRCADIVLFDQSEQMLEECRKKATALEVLDRCSFVRGDFFTHVFSEQAYDTALVGFFLSHLTGEQEASV